MLKFSLKRRHFSLKKFSFDDFLITTWEREVESQRKKEPENLGPKRQFFVKSFVAISEYINFIDIFYNFNF